MDKFINKVIQGDCLEKLKELEDNSVDSIITDPPYGIGFMGKSWDKYDPTVNKGSFKVGTGTHPQGYVAIDKNAFYDFSFKWAVECLRVLKPGGHLLSFGGCYDKETEILTSKGWKYFKDVTKKDVVATLNPETEEIIYQNPIEIVKYDNYKQLYHFKTNKIDLMVTPNHKMLVKYLGGYKNAKWKLTRADAIKNAIKMKKNGVWKGEEVEYFVLPKTTQSNGHKIKIIPEKKIPMDIWLKFLGLWIAEGSATITNVSTGKGYNTQICHFNNKNLDELYYELKKYFNICRYKESGKFRINNKQLTEYLQPFCYSWLKHIPEEIKQLSSRQLKIFLDWYMRGDSDGRRCYTCSKKLVDDLQEIALKIGISADYVVCNNKEGSIKDRRIIQKHIQYAVSINFKQNEPEVYQKKKKKAIVNIVNYDDFVYCVEVPLYNTLYIRRNGKTSWCGNTRTYHRMASAIEDAGFEVRDMIEWVYGSGFPKSLNIGKAVDKLQGNEREEIEKIFPDGSKPRKSQHINFYAEQEGNVGKATYTKGTSEWEGWGTALKPSHEPIVWATKSLTNKNQFAIMKDINSNLISTIWQSLENLQKQDTFKLQETVLIHLNTALLWQNILVELLKNESKFTTSTASKMITELKILNSLLLKNTQDDTDGKFQTYQNGTQESQANGLDLLVGIVESCLAGEKKSIANIQTLIVQGLATYKQNRTGMTVKNVEQDLLPIILNANSVLISVLTNIITELSQNELSTFVSFAEKSLKQYLAEPQSIADENVWQEHIQKALPNHSPICMARKPLARVLLNDLYKMYGFDYYITTSSASEGSKRYLSFIEKGFEPVEENFNEVKERITTQVEKKYEDNEDDTINYEAEIEEKLLKAKPKKIFRFITKLATNPNVESSWSIETAKGVETLKTEKYKKIYKDNVSVNALRYGTGGINIDESRVEYNGEKPNIGGRANHTRGEGYGFKELGENIEANTQGRFPANLILTWKENEYIIKEDITNEQKEKVCTWLQKNL